MIEPADHPLTDAEISERFGGLLREGVNAFKDDMMYLVDVAEDWARAHRAPAPPTPEERERTGMERQRQAVLTREIKARQDAILRERFEQGVAGSAVAKELRMSESTILQRWREMGLSAASRPRVQVERAKRPGQAERERVVREHAERGVMQKDTAAFLGISTQGVYLIRKRLSIS